MSEYICEKCKKEFKKESSYVRHLDRKTSCVSKNKKINFKEKIPKPILKWVGGKTQILDKILNNFPVSMNNYHEIFLGGGSVLFGLLSYVKNKIIKLNGEIYAYDINKPLIYLYKNIQCNHQELYEETLKLIEEFNSCQEESGNRSPSNIEEAMVSKESYYYWTRSKYNNLNEEDKISIIGSSLFIFLNKTCFRGIFRMGPNGFNVPYGNYKKPEIINKEHLDEIHELIQNVNFIWCDFRVSLDNIGFEDFAYLDPPYVPEKETSFVKYTKDGFNFDDHNRLFETINLLSENKKIMMSNADVSLVRCSFTDKKYKIESIVCKRAINSKNPESKSKELIIKNY